MQTEFLTQISFHAEDGDMNGPYMGEEKVMFGVFAHAMSQMTIAKIRKIYNKVDSKSIAKQVCEGNGYITPNILT